MRAEILTGITKWNQKTNRIFGATQTRDVTLCARGECDDDVHSKEEEEEEEEEKISRIHSVTARALAPKSRF
jgi:hypothetical protein